MREMPKFKTPEEELSFLRSHIAKREQELIDSGKFENSASNAIHEVVSSYKRVPIENVVHPDSVLTSKEKDAIVLALSPESHDAVMEELLGIVLTKGLKNAFALIDQMKNPHVDDDFHRVLVQYFKTGQISQVVKEGTPLYKSLNMTLFEINSTSARR